ncbi:MAG: DUF1439 domain-containing protein [Gammaproteobacteria bacterium]|nr:DUF1439 domain-containing protein [Gammaproteobacteria bacterium]MDH5652551.1 DUF1439 domain-containing protein [Gammaproteobacteria bacterium]
MRTFIFTILFCCFSMNVNAISLEFTEQELQDKVTAMMPLEKKKGIMTIVLTNPAVRLNQETNRMGIKVDMAVDVLGSLKSTGHAEISGELMYNKKQGTFHLVKPEIGDMHIDKLPNKYQPKVKELAQQALEKTMEKRPVYELRDDSLKQKLARATLKNVSVKDGKLVVEFGLF